MDGRQMTGQRTGEIKVFIVSREAIGDLIFLETCNPVNLRAADRRHFLFLREAD